MPSHAPIRLGFVGTGYIAGVVATALRETDHVRLAAVASRNLATAESFAAAHGDGATPRPFDDWRGMLAWEGIDAVYLCSPTTTRTEIAIAAAARGKHVLVEKPFPSVEALVSITDACRAHGVAFLDATHFVHHPRHHLLRRTLHERIGTLLAVNATFTFPSMDRANIRHDARLEPMGAWGDMGWYAMRALVEFTPDTSALAFAAAVARRDPQSHAVVRSDGVLRLADGCTATWDVAFDIGTCVMDLHLMGTEGRVRLDDFVLDWAGGYAVPVPGHVAQFAVQRGPVNPSGIAVERVPSPRRQLVQLAEEFAALARDPRGEACAAGMRASRRTQQLLDAVWERQVEG
ncbi:MAG TPA: Gfo/Idh/MocA family oxidoreductase [Gemmatimonadaceae bacterium]|nr:Gfo/Idh/MocA family oxidoreductase [Gemmatimonadaceae bacterium]